VPDLPSTFVDRDDLDDIRRDLLTGGTAAVGLAVWILALHFPKRPRRIAGIRHGTLEPVPWPPRFA
jgi:hypothetical protein